MGKTLGYGEITVANMTEPFTVMLTNEAQQFATDSNRKVTSAQSYYTDIIVIRGSQERTDYTIGNITSSSGITVSKSSKRVTFSVSAGATIRADTGVIEIPITLDGQTVKKQFSWSCGKQGPQGVKGQDGTSIKITSKSVTYQTSTSGTTVPTGTWVTTVPTVANGQYLWTKTTVQYSDGNKTEAYSVSYKGTNGTNGTSVTVSKTEVTYQVSTSGTTAPTGTWSTTMPSCDQGQYLWTKTYVKYSDGKETTSYSVSYKGVDGEKFSWNLFTCSTLTDGDQENKANWRRGFINNSTHIGYTNDGFHFTTNEQGSKDSNGISFNISRDKSGLHVGDTVTFSVDIKGTIGTGNPQMQYWGSTKTDSSDWATRVFGDSLKTVKKDSYTRYSVTAILGDLYSSKSNDLFCVGGGFDADLYIKNIKLEKCSTATPWAPHPEDLEGRGVSQTVQYYLATSQASGVTSSTSGWSTDITTQKLTADKKYLWNCYQTKYSDGTSEPISTPKVIGVYGDKGQNAKNLSITPSSQYFKSTDGGKTFAPNAITIKPTIQGEISFGKWQYSIDGGVSFADVVSGQKGLTVSNNVLAVSKDSSLYSDAVTMVTFRAVANDSSFYDTCSIAKIYDVSDIQIGGRNLLWNSGTATAIQNSGEWNAHGCTATTETRNNCLVSRVNSAWNGYQFNLKKIIERYNLVDGDILTYSIDVKMDEPIDILFVNNYYADNKGCTGGISTVNHWDGKYFTIGKWERLSFTFKITQDTLDKIATDTYRQGVRTAFEPIKATSVGKYVYFACPKLERGTKPTDWTPAPEDVQTAILSTKSEISDVSLKVDKNKQAIEQRVEKTTYQQDLNLVKGDISKANEGLNKWRYEIYPKSLFASEYQGKSTMDVFAKNTNLTPSQSVLINDTDFGKSLAYGDNYIGYALTFVKFSAAKSIAITFKHDDGAHLYLNGKLIGGDDTCNTGSGESLTLSFIQGWNCLEVVLNEKSGGEYIGLGTTISAISECQLMNCYYGTPVARQSHITNQLVQNTTDIEGVTTTMQKVMTTVGGSDRIDEFVNNYNKTIESEKQFKKTIGETYTTKDEFNGLEIGGRNLLTKDDCNMSKWQNLFPAHCKATNNNYSNHIDYVPTGGEWEIIYKKISVTKGQKYILSFDYKVNKAYNYLSGQKYGVYLSTSVPTNAAPANIITNGQYVIENTVTSLKRGVITFTAPIDTLYIVINGGCIDDNQTGLSFEFNKWKLEKGNKITDWTPAPEDNEINGQNLVSNLPSNWEQGSFVVEDDSKNKTYSEVKVSEKTQIRIKELIPVFGDITISAQAIQNSSKESLNHYVILFDVNKRYMGKHNVNGWNTSFPRMFNCGDAKYIAIALKWGDGTKTQITPSDISQICLKIERGTSATPFTLAPEDVNGKIVNVETIANQTAKKFEWIVKGGDSSSNFTLTDRVADLVAERINFKGLVTFSGLNTDAKNEIGKVAQSKVDGLEIGGRNLIINSNLSRTLTNVTNDGCSNMTVVSDSVYGHALKFTAVNQRRVFWATSNVWVKNKTYTVSFVAKSSVTGQKIRPSRSTADWGDDITLTTSYARYTTKITSLDTNAGGTLSFSCTNAVGDITITNVKLEVGNKATDWTPAPEDVSQDATNKASQALTDAKNYSSNAVNWVTNNGSSTTSLNSMVKKWTDGAVSDTVQINGGWIKANTITASKIALADFTNYSQLTRDTADAYGFTVTDDTDGTWFSTKNIKRDQFISEIFPCNGGESYLIEYDISTNAKGANNSTDTKNYIGVAIGVYGYTGTVGSNGLPNKATNIWYADRITGSETAPSIHVKTTITTSTATKQFRVFLQSNGYYFEGTTKIRNLSVRRMYGGTLIVDGSITADKIATDAIKSRNYISSGGTQGSFLNLSDGSFQSPNLSWDSNGNLIAKNATLSGEITATNGSIAGWTIISNKMYTTGSGKYTGIGKYGSAYAFWAGATSNDNGNSAVFKVGHTGKLTATDADITGTITATNGKIGRYDITSTYLMTNSGSNASGIGGNQAFWAGAEDSNSAPFRVGYDGVLWAENAAIRGSIETGNLGDEGDTVSIINGHIGIQGTSNNVEIYSTGFKFGIDGDYYLMSVSEGVKCYRNLYATDFVADGWLYCSEVHSSGAVVIGADSESFYWAHGYQIARGTSWGGVCVGDDSQQLRLYGSSIWASHSISTSDENLKENFTTLDQYENFYMNLNPIGFNYIGDYDGKKTHFGFGAHKTEDVLESEGYDADKFAVVTHRPLVQEDIEKRFGKDVEVDIETEYGVSYTEFIALNTHMIQKTRRELTKVKQEKADLEVRLQAIEAKLGL